MVHFESWQSSESQQSACDLQVSSAYRQSAFQRTKTVSAYAEDAATSPAVNANVITTLPQIRHMST